MVAGEVVGGVFLTRDELFGVEELTVGVVADLIDDDGFKVDKESMGDVELRCGLWYGWLVRKNSQRLWLRVVKCGQ